VLDHKRHPGTWWFGAAPVIGTGTVVAWSTGHPAASIAGMLLFPAVMLVGARVTAPRRTPAQFPAPPLEATPEAEATSLPPEAPAGEPVTATGGVA
jgi:hypothetical protein